ncbi:MAG: PQQ-dependent sugar dehydrogenase [Actinobacteria bacterium]|nr:PQQ-dependent sugar dehydrogenase [Actinomycetota bacterium]
MRLVLLPIALIGVLAAIGLVSRSDAPGAAPSPDVELVEVGRYEQPVYATSPPGDDRLFVVERTGRVWIVERGRRLARPFLDLSRRVSVDGYEEGLLSLAFAPDYATSGLLYVDYNDIEHRTIVEEFRSDTDPNVADPGSARKVLVIPNPSRAHHGGHILFGADRYLYISQGDGGIYRDPAFPAQSLDSLHGKILRIDPRRQGTKPYRVPPSNPFVGGPGRDEIWVYGLRNPWRIALEPETGALVIGDVGALIAEELNVALQAGINFGWSCLEGTSPYAIDPPPSCAEELVPPAIELVRGSVPVTDPAGAAPIVTRGRPKVDTRLETGEPVCSVVAGVFVRDPALPSLAGRHLYGDFCDSSLRSFRLQGGQAVDQRLVGLDVLLLSSFGVDAAGRVYATSLAGPVYRLEAR